MGNAGHKACVIVAGVGECQSRAEQQSGGDCDVLLQCHKGILEAAYGACWKGSVLLSYGVAGRARSYKGSAIRRR